jgi:hypothetical protein
MSGTVKDESKHVVAAPAKPLSVWQSTFFGAAVGAAVAAVVGPLLIKLHNGLWGKKTEDLMARTVNLAIDTSVVGALLGHSKGESNQYLYQSQLENAQLKNAILEMKRADSHVEQIQPDVTQPMHRG